MKYIKIKKLEKLKVVIERVLIHEKWNMLIQVIDINNFKSEIQQKKIYAKI